MPDNRVLDATMTELEDRGLVGWDKAVNRYDLHPIVYSVVWQALSARARQDMYAALTAISTRCRDHRHGRMWNASKT